MKHFIFSVFLLLPVVVVSQDQNFWDTLAKVRFENRKDKSGYDVEVPVFSPPLLAFHNKKITLKGYIIPLEELGGQGRFMLSALPFNLCFFCGAAGPETVIEVQTPLKIPFTTKPITLEGTLLLNDKDPNHHMYILSAAKRLN
ncbi:hypothetical protein [Dawidia soli]|uniref:DUF3299 domain-containing protein n=1 Tax=Dawidia soli TaxID=2782352 RepID=A0AAP2D7D4_9BACT|nr:hypothetical protein [Dawidia soli]MBT1686761.1 hypothetical protein [Dawidia soli]